MEDDEGYQVDRSSLHRVERESKRAFPSLLLLPPVPLLSFLDLDFNFDALSPTSTSTLEPKLTSILLFFLSLSTFRSPWEETRRFPLEMGTLDGTGSTSSTSESSPLPSESPTIGCTMVSLVYSDFVANEKGILELTSPRRPFLLFFSFDHLPLQDSPTPSELLFETPSSPTDSTTATLPTPRDRQERMPGGPL